MSPARRLIAAVRAWRTRRLVERLRREKAAERSPAARFARVGMHMSMATGDHPPSKKRR